MKALGLALALALVALAWQALPSAHGTADVSLVTAGIDGGGAPQSQCGPADGDRPRGCEADELAPIIVAGIDGSGHH